MAKYNVILADPPWEYRNRQNNDPARGGFEYPILTDADIRNLPIYKIAAEDCFLFIWITMPKLPSVFPVIEDWGFEYITGAFTWIKLNKKGSALWDEDGNLVLKRGFYSGTGSYTNSNTELCLLAKRGSPRRVARNVKQPVFAPVSQHSRKPDQVHTCIEQLCGDVPRIELFARRPFPGWETTGLDLDGVDIRDYLEWNKDER